MSNKSKYMEIMRLHHFLFATMKPQTAMTAMLEILRLEDTIAHRDYIMALSNREFGDPRHKYIYLDHHYNSLGIQKLKKKYRIGQIAVQEVIKNEYLDEDARLDQHPLFKHINPGRIEEVIKTWHAFPLNALPNLSNKH